MDLFLLDELRPFLIAGFVVIGLLILEVALMMFGLSSGGMDDAPTLDSGEIETDLTGMNSSVIAAELGIEPEFAAKIETGLAGIDAEAELEAEPELPDSAGTDAGSTSLIGTVLDLLGLRKLPFTISLAVFLACFSAVGLFAQMILQASLGRMLPVWIMMVIALICAAFLTRKLGRFLLFLIPRDESSAISERSLGKRAGTVTVGTASAGNPAQVRVMDLYGNAHYTMAEPLAPDEIINEGTEVLVLRVRGGSYRIIKLE